MLFFPTLRFFAHFAVWLEKIPHNSLFYYNFRQLLPLLNNQICTTFLQSLIIYGQFYWIPYIVSQTISSVAFQVTSISFKLAVLQSFVVFTKHVQLQLFVE